MRKRQYLAREALGAILFPVTLAIVVSLLVLFKMIPPEYHDIFNIWVIVTVVATLLALSISYVIVFRKRR